MEGEFWAPVVEGPTGEKYVHFGAARYREDAARSAWKKEYKSHRRQWRERNRMIEVRRFTFAAADMTGKEWVGGLESL